MDFFPLGLAFVPFLMGNYSLARFCNTIKRQELQKESALMNTTMKKESEWELLICKGSVSGMD